MSLDHNETLRRHGVGRIAADATACRARPPLNEHLIMGVGKLGPSVMYNKYRTSSTIYP